MKKIVFCGYRDWAYNLLDHAASHCMKRGDVVISDVIFSEKEPTSFLLPSSMKLHYFDGSNKLIYKEVLDASKAELIIFAGWSWLVPEEITERFCCICIHPSDLPSFAGGSPVQNQVLSGITESKLTVFKMDAGIDTGPVYKKAPISLLGPIEEVFEKISLAGLPIIRDLISDFVNNELIFVPQVVVENFGVSLRRRQPEDSIYTLQVISSMSFLNFERAINVLRDPYPNLKISIDNFHIVVRNAIKVKHMPVDITQITEYGFVPPSEGAPICIAISDGYAVIADYSCEYTLNDKKA